jgi:hypothetical protein
MAKAGRSKQRRAAPRRPAALPPGRGRGGALLKAEFLSYVRYSGRFRLFSSLVFNFFSADFVQ